VLFISPLPAALTWQEQGFNRAYFMIVPIILMASYALGILWKERKEIVWFRIISVFAIILYVIQTTYVWNLYFFHYPLRATTIRSWQCGYKQLVQLLNNSYKQDTIYLTSENGQPYIFLLFYQKYSPNNFINSVKRTMVDKYGFTQVLGFDRFVFSNNQANNTNTKSLYVLSQAETQNEDRIMGLHHVQSIMCGTEHMFELYEPATTKTNQTR